MPFARAGTLATDVVWMPCLTEPQVPDVRAYIPVFVMDRHVNEAMRARQITAGALDDATGDEASDSLDPVMPPLPYGTTLTMHIA